MIKIKSLFAFLMIAALSTSLSAQDKLFTLEDLNSCSPRTCG